MNTTNGKLLNSVAISADHYRFELGVKKPVVAGWRSRFSRKAANSRQFPQTRAGIAKNARCRPANSRQFPPTVPTKAANSRQFPPGDSAQAAKSRHGRRRRLCVSREGTKTLSKPINEIGS